MTPHGLATVAVDPHLTLGILDVHLQALSRARSQLRKTPPVHGTPNYEALCIAVQCIAAGSVQLTNALANSLGK